MVSGGGSSGTKQIYKPVTLCEEDVTESIMRFSQPSETPFPLAPCAGAKILPTQLRPNQFCACQ